MQAFVDKNRGNASKASMAQSRLKAMSRLEVVAAIMDDPSLHFGFPEPEPLPTPILQAWAMHAWAMRVYACVHIHAHVHAHVHVQTHAVQLVGMSPRTVLRC